MTYARRSVGGMATLPHHRQNAAVLLSRTYVFAAFGGRWPGVVFLISALSGKLALGPIVPYSAQLFEIWV